MNDYTQEAKDKPETFGNILRSFFFYFIFREIFTILFMTIERMWIMVLEKLENIDFNDLYENFMLKSDNINRSEK